MFAGLNNEEESFTNKLLKGGIALANLSLSKFINSPILINMINTGTFKLSQAHFKPHATGSAALIKTELVGEMEGVNYLIFSERELKKLYSTCLGENYDQLPDSETMKQGLLTEVSNVMASSFISEIAETLGLEMYPNVPSILPLEGKDIDQYILSNSGKIQNMIYLNVQLQGKDLDITPEFIWILHENFLNNIKEQVLV